ncbi:MAG TPA: UrcA family protein [Allosphingosinicella sp.]
MKTITTLAALLAAATVTASGIGHVAHAQAPAARTVAIHYGDLDLGSRAGRSALDHRIRQAVRQACGDASSVDLRGQNQVAACRDDLAASLVPQRDAAFASAGNAGTTLIARR